MAATSKPVSQPIGKPTPRKLKPAPPALKSLYIATADLPRPSRDTSPITRCLSVCQPWATSIAFGWKSVENRSWSTAYRGWVAIHASSANRHYTEENDYFIRQQHPEIEEIMCREGYWGVGDNGKGFDFGAVVGAANIVGCVEWLGETGKNGQSFEAACIAAGFGEWYGRQPVPPAAWAQPGFCWLIDGAVEFKPSIEMKGALNLFTLKPEMADAVAAAKMVRRQLVDGEIACQAIE